MDKYEYKVRADEIKRLIAEQDYIQAAEIADTIDWRRVKSVLMLCTVSDLYKINRRYDDAKNMLLLAYERRPGGRTICYSLCELCIKTEDFLQAVNYYKEFVQAAPKDPGRYILQYKIYEAQEVSLEERIGVLEELKKRDYREKWAYELAYLYHRVGLGTRCVEECDELILWFGSGKYVTKAMELKMLHQPLTPAQQEAYDHRFDQYVPEQTEESAYQDQEYGEESEHTHEDVYGQEAEAGYGEEDYGQVSADGEESFRPEDGEAYGQTGYWDSEETWAGQEGMLPEQEEASAGTDELDIQVKTMDVGKFNTINLQEELAAGLQEVLGAEDGDSAAVTPQEEDEQIRDRLIQEAGAEELAYPAGEESEEEEVEVFFGETGELKSVSEDVLRDASVCAGGKRPVSGEEDISGAETGPEDVPGPDAEADDVSRPDTEKAVVRELGSATEKAVVRELGSATERAVVRELGSATGDTRKPEPVTDETGELVMKQMREESARAAGEPLQESDMQPPKELAGVLSQETDGQLRLVVPESAAVEKQITGQMKIEDILAEWERMKKESREKSQEEVRRRVLQQTGPMFTEFEAAVRDGLLEQLERDKDAESGQTGKPERKEDTVYGEEDRLTAEERELYKESGEEGYLTAEDGGVYEETGEEDYLTAENREVYEKTGEEGYLTAENREVYEETGEEDYLTAENREVYEGSGEEGYLTAEDGEVYEESGEEDYLTAEDRELYEETREEDYLTAEDRELYEETGEEDYLTAEDREAYEETGEEDYLTPGHRESHEEYGRGEYGTAGREETAEEINEEDELDGEERPAEEEAAASDTGADGTDPEAEQNVPGEAVPEALEERKEPEDNGEVKGRKSRKALKAEKAAAKREKAEKKSLETQDTAEDWETEDREEENREEQRQPIERDRAKVRALTREEKELYAAFIQSRRSKEQLVKAIDNISMAAYTGNIVVTGEEGMDTMTLVQNMIREVQLTDSNFSGKVAKISGKGLNDRDVRKTLEEMNGGALIIYRASGMNKETAMSLYRSLQQERLGIIVALEDTKRGVQKLFQENAQLTGAFTARMDMEALSNDTLVLFGKRYAREKEHSIDDLGILALHTRIEEMQTIDHVVTVVDVKKIVDDAIRHAGRKTLGHFFDILFAKRYDDEDMVILTEKDFVA